MGFLYALATPSMHGIVKIGATTRDVSERLCEANASHTWCPPEPYALVCCVEVEDPFAVEHRVHAAICARRVNPRREFFHATPDEVSALFGMLVPIQNAPPGAAPASVQCGQCGQCAAPAAPSHPPVQLARTVVAQTPEGKLRKWVEERYTHVPLREKDGGTKLEALYAAYTLAAPPVHAKVLGKILFGKMLNTVFPNIGPHRTTTGASEVYLLAAVKGPPKGAPKAVVCPLNAEFQESNFSPS